MVQFEDFARLTCVLEGTDWIWPRPSTVRERMVQLGESSEEVVRIPLDSGSREVKERDAGSLLASLRAL